MFKRVALIALALAAVSTGAAATDAPQRPRLVVLISIDQFRADFLTRFADLYRAPGGDRRPGGFRWLTERGAWYLDCRFQHYRTVTGVGHAVLSTGAQPALHGIVGNDWFDRSTGKTVYCVDGPASKVVGALPGSKETPMSAATLLSTTIGDELELATGGRARTVSLSVKDRAAILLAGHRADTVIWFDETTATWVSSDFYAPSGSLPAWVQSLNAQRLPDKLREKPWKPDVPAGALDRASPQPGKPLEFEHPLAGKTYSAFLTSPAGNRFVFESARQAVWAEKLGQDEIPDILSLNLASNDFVGHSYGPDSAEALDISVQTDRQLADFLTFLEKNVPGGLSRVTIAISADHGVASVPELQKAGRVPAGRLVLSGLRTAVDKALDDAIAPEDWIASTANGEIYFRAAALAKHLEVPRERVESVAVEAARAFPKVAAAYGRTDVLSSRVPATPYGTRLVNNLHLGRSGDVFVILEPGWIPGSLPVGTGSTHGSPMPYDTQVPMVLGGFGIERGLHSAPVAPAQLAPTLAHILGIARPTAADEAVLPGLAGVR